MALVEKNLDDILSQIWRNWITSMFLGLVDLIHYKLADVIFVVRCLDPNICSFCELTLDIIIASARNENLKLWRLINEVAKGINELRSRLFMSLIQDV